MIMFIRHIIVTTYEMRQILWNIPNKTQKLNALHFLTLNKLQYTTKKSIMIMLCNVIFHSSFQIHVFIVPVYIYRLDLLMYRFLCSFDYTIHPIGKTISLHSIKKHTANINITYDDHDGKHNILQHIWYTRCIRYPDLKKNNDSNYRSYSIFFPIIPRCDSSNGQSWNKSNLDIRWKHTYIYIYILRLCYGHRS